MKITRDVVLDLLPVYLAGEASADTRRLVEEFVQTDAELARLVREDRSSRLLDAPVALHPDDEMKAFRRTRLALYRHEWPLFFAILFSSFAFGRIVSDTSWDVSPRNFVITAAVAGVFWVVFLVRLVRRQVALR